jgi:hypothetical protein
MRKKDQNNSSLKKGEERGKKGPGQQQFKERKGKRKKMIRVATF